MNRLPYFLDLVHGRLFENLTLLTTNKQNDARLDVKANGFWRKRQTAFFDVRVTHVIHKLIKIITLQQFFGNTNELKTHNICSVFFEVEHTTFTPFVFGTKGGMGEEE